MDDLDTPQKRLERFIRVVFGQKTAFAEKLGVNRNDLSKYTGKGKSVFTKPETVKKLKELGLNYEWYIEGKGIMFPQNALGIELAVKTGQHLSIGGEIAGGDIDRIIEASLRGETKIKSNVASVSTDIKVSIPDISNLTPAQALKLKADIDSKYDRLKKLAEIAEIEE